MVESLKEKYLLFKAGKGSSEAVAEIFDRYFNKIYRFIYFRTKSQEDAEDLTSDVFLQFQSFINKKGEVKSLSGLLYQIARNKLIDFYRKKRPEQIPIETLEIQEDSVKKLSDLLLDNHNLRLETGADIQTVLKVLDTLKAEYREVIILHYINEMTVRELSEALEKKENNIRVMLFRALGALREKLQNSHEQQNLGKNFKESGVA